MITTRLDREFYKKRSLRWGDRIKSIKTNLNCQYPKTPQCPTAIARTSHPLYEQEESQSFIGMGAST
ncbi:MAG TPA: hypothetical protein V6D43_02380 [Candidatus Sericytochromatia bacterium]